ncbi:hypothetical protein EBN03_20790 [Nocardia stercoris]|uniref:Novel STAND NTPase 1 domain-containing protein n=1 Tax=Nocardia stercoris TaxID=2483361 RepID=A0A3M2KZ11_9NOCA|nr:hypothetical protein EBN03_20790 [Nocardia stercoris]
MDAPVVQRSNPSPRRVFADRLNALFEAAGKPTLGSIATAASARSSAAGGGPISLQRISDWRKAKTMPSNFEALAPVVIALVEKAQRASRPLDPELAQLTVWRKIWQTAHDWDPESEATCPYPGLGAYRDRDSEWFFGRARATTELTALVRGAATVQEPGLIVVMGASGAGKSSLLHAGLIPALGGWTVATMTPGARPAETLSELIGSGDVAAPELVVVDQFEETFTLCAGEPERRKFLDHLLELADPNRTTRTVVVVAVRADFIPQCLGYPTLADAINARCYALGPMRIEELTEAVTGPARAVGLNLETGLAELVITELCGLGGEHERSYDPGSLPLLSHVMAATWACRANARLTVAGYRKVGGVAGSVTTTAEQAWQDLTPAEQNAAEEVLLALVAVGSDGPDTRRRVPRAQVVARAADPGAAQTALARLIDARLITADSIEAESGVTGEIVWFTHEIVLQAWPRLRAWIDAGRVDLLVRQRVALDAAEWVGSERDSALLYRGARLEAARRAGGATAGAVGEFLTAAQHAHLRHRRLVLATRAALAVLGVVVLVLGIAAYAQTRISEQANNNADLVQILAEADSIRGADPSLSAQLELVADQLRPGDPDIRSRLLRTQNLPLGDPLTGPAGAVHQVAYRPDGQLLASAGADGTIRLWNVSGTPGPAGPPITCGKPVTGTTFSSDGRLLAAACGDGARLWDVTDPAAPALQTHLSDAATGVVFGPGHTLATTDSTRVQVWRIDNPAAPVTGGELRPGTGRVVSIAYTPTGNLVVAGPHSVEIWTTGSAPHRTGAPITVPGNGIQSAALSPDGTTLALGSGDDADQATGDVDATVGLWNIADPAGPLPIGPPLVVAAKSELRSLAFDADGTVLAAGDRNKVTLWSVHDPAHPTRIGEPLTAPSPSCPETNLGQICVDSPVTLAFGSGGHTVAVGGALGGLRLWSLPPAIVGGRIGWSADLAAPSSAGTMLTSVRNGRLELWDIHDRRSVRLLADLGPGPMPGAKTNFPAISSSGRLAVGPVGPNGGLKLLDISDPSHVRPLYDFPDAIAGGFDVENRFLLEFLHGFTVRLWDLSDPAHPVATASAVYGTESGDRGQRVGGMVGHTMVTIGLDATTTGAPQSVLRIWDVSRRGEAREVQRIPSEPDRPYSWFATTADGHTMAIPAGNTVLVWDISLLGHARQLGDPITVGPLNVQSVDFNADGTLMATSDADSTVRLWDLHDRSHPRPIGQSITMPGTSSWNISFDPSSNRLIGVNSGTMSIWDLDDNEARHRICDAARGVLTPEVWAAHLPRLPYHSPCQAIPTGR